MTFDEHGFTLSAVDRSTTIRYDFESKSLVPTDGKHLKPVERAEGSQLLDAEYFFYMARLGWALSEKVEDGSYEPINRIPTLGEIRAGLRTEESSIISENIDSAMASTNLTSAGEDIALTPSMVSRFQQLIKDPEPFILQVKKELGLSPQIASRAKERVNYIDEFGKRRQAQIYSQEYQVIQGNTPSLTDEISQNKKFRLTWLNATTLRVFTQAEDEKERVRLSKMIKTILSDQASLSDLGGIDLNANEKLIQQNGSRINLPVLNDSSQWKDFQTNGFVPVIINITPPGNLLMLLGLKSSTPVSEMASALN